MIVTKERFLLVWALIATVLVVILFSLKSCSGKGKDSYTTLSIDYVYDTIEVSKPFPVYTPTLVKVTTPGKTIIDSVPYVDSNYCKQLAIEYFSQKEYLDTVNGDSIDVIVQSWVSKNNLDSIKPTVNIKIPYIQTIITPIPKTPWKFYVGANIGTNGLGFIGGPEITLTDRNRMLYKAGVDFSTYTTPVYRLGFGVKLSFPKKK